MALSAKRYVIERARASQRALGTVNKTSFAREGKDRDNWKETKN